MFLFFFALRSIYAFFLHQNKMFFYFFLFLCRHFWYLNFIIIFFCLVVATQMLIMNFIFLMHMFFPCCCIFFIIIIRSLFLSLSLSACNLSVVVLFYKQFLASIICWRYCDISLEMSVWLSVCLSVFECILWHWHLPVYDFVCSTGVGSMNFLHF